MTIRYEILGGAGQDNAVFVRVDSGQKVARLLLDCGEGCISTLPVSEIQAVDHLLFSHFHMDHISGFDSYFRIVYDRTTKQNIIWGPPNASSVLHHRFQGFLWNLHQQLEGQWHVNDIYSDRIEQTRFNANEAFVVSHSDGTKLSSGVIIETPEYCVEAYQMDHQTPSMAYIIRENARTNVDTNKLTVLGLRPGTWLKTLKDPLVNDDETLQIEGTPYRLSDLRRELLIETSGQSLAYLTDFLMDETAVEKLIPVLQGVTVMICESQYLYADIALAQRNYHMTAMQVAQVAQKANVNELILFHISDRYTPNEWLQLLDEAKQIFPNTSFPSHWNLC
jgi:ribonuclease Z